MNPTNLLFFDEENLVSFFDDTSSSDDDIEIACALLKSFHERKKSKILLKENQRILVRDYSEKYFLENFRFNQMVVYELICDYESSDDYKKFQNESTAEGCICSEDVILVFLFFAGNDQIDLEEVSARFNIPVKTVSDIIQNVSKYLITFSGSFIQWPDLDKQALTEQYYLRKHKFPYVCGLLDAFHIKIEEPESEPHLYVNKSNYHSIILQAVFDHTKKLIDVYIGEPGSHSDGYVYKNSPLHSKLIEKPLDAYLIGDGAYPLSKGLLTPYQLFGPRKVQERAFNDGLEKCLDEVRQAFELLTRRFRQLCHVKLQQPLVTEFIKACCVLHNLGDIDDQDVFIEGFETAEEQPEEVPCPESPNLDVASLRDRISGEICALQDQKH